MESIAMSGRLKAGTKSLPQKKSQQMHSPAHLLADELCKKFGEPRRYGFYLKVCTTHDMGLVRTLMGRVLEQSNVRSPGKLFSFLLKKHHDEQKVAQTPTPTQTTLL